jgi:hypothetical protein
LFNNCRNVQAQSFVNPQAGSLAQDQVGPFAARAEDEKHPETEGEGEVAALARTPWTPEEDKRLRMLIEACKPIEIVAAELKRSVHPFESATAIRVLCLRLRQSSRRLIVPHGIGVERLRDPPTADGS